VSTLVEELNDLLCFSYVVWFIEQRNDPVWHIFRKWELLPDFLFYFFGNGVIVNDLEVCLLILFDVLDLVLDDIIIIEQKDLGIFKFQIILFFVINQLNGVKTHKLT